MWNVNVAPKSDAKSRTVVYQSDKCSIRNVKLLSFGADEDEGEEASVKKKAIFRPDRKYREFIAVGYVFNDIFPSPSGPG